jgi:integrase
LRSGTVFKLTLANFATDGQVSTKTKNGGWVTVPVSERLAALVATARAMRGPFGPATPIYRILGYNLRGTVLHNGAMSRRLKRAQKLAGTSGWTWHDLRRTAAHRLYEATGDLRDVRDLLGHHNLGSSLIYLAAQQKAVPSTKLALYASGNGAQNAS